jgi:hypothetical protein
VTVPALCLLRFKRPVALCVCNRHGADEANDQAKDNSTKGGPSCEKGDGDPLGFLFRATNERAKQRRSCHCVDSANRVVATAVDCRKMHREFFCCWLVVVVGLSLSFWKLALPERFAEIEMLTGKAVWVASVIAVRDASGHCVNYDQRLLVGVLVW